MDISTDMGIALDDDPMRPESRDGNKELYEVAGRLHAGGRTQLIALNRKEKGDYEFYFSGRGVINYVTEYRSARSVSPTEAALRSEARRGALTCSEFEVKLRPGMSLSVKLLTLGACDRRTAQPLQRALRGAVDSREDDQRLALVTGEGEGFVREVEPPGQGVDEAPGAVRLLPDVLGRPQDPELGAARTELGDEFPQAGMVRVTRGGEAQVADGLTGDLIPLRVQAACRVVQEDVTGEVRTACRRPGQAGDQGQSELVGGENVHPGGEGT